MYGGVTVPYTTIGGFNMDSGIMAANITGSSGDATDGTNRTITVTWVLPGGIENKGKLSPEGGEWAYTLWTRDANPIAATDYDIVQAFKGDYPDCNFTDDYNLAEDSMGYEQVLTDWINNKLYAYMGRLLDLLGGSDYTQFREYFTESCVHVNW